MIDEALVKEEGLSDEEKLSAEKQKILAGRKATTVLANAWIRWRSEQPSKSSDDRKTIAIYSLKCQAHAGHSGADDVINGRPPKPGYQSYEMLAAFLSKQPPEHFKLSPEEYAVERAAMESLLPREAKPNLTKEQEEIIAWTNAWINWWIEKNPGKPEKDTPHKRRGAALRGLGNCAGLSVRQIDRIFSGKANTSEYDRMSDRMKEQMAKYGPEHFAALPPNIVPPIHTETNTAASGVMTAPTPLPPEIAPVAVPPAPVAPQPQNIASSTAEATVPSVDVSAPPADAVNTSTADAQTAPKPEPNIRITMKNPGHPPLSTGKGSREHLKKPKSAAQQLYFSQPQPRRINKTEEIANTKTAKFKQMAKEAMQIKKLAMNLTLPQRENFPVFPADQPSSPDSQKFAKLEEQLMELADALGSLDSYGMPANPRAIHTMIIMLNGFSRKRPNSEEHVVQKTYDEICEGMKKLFAMISLELKVKENCHAK